MTTVMDTLVIDDYNYVDLVYNATEYQYKKNVLM